MNQLLAPAESKLIVDFVLSVVFSLLIGIELNNRLGEEERSKVFGTDRTFAFIGTLGFILYVITPGSLTAYLTGFCMIGGLLAVYYFLRSQNQQTYGITAIVLAFVVYVLPAFIITQERWFSLLVIVIVMTLSEIKPQIKAFSSKILSGEFLTLSKFLVITGVILPLVPDREFIPYIAISPHKLWLAIVVISSISYISYLVRKFMFPNAGLLLSGVLGGLYSSTATTFILAKKSKEVPGSRYEYTAAILAANTMLFLRVWIIIAIFNQPLASETAPVFAAMILVGTVATYFMHRKIEPTVVNTSSTGIIDSNPLELRVAILFGGLYMIFALLTSYVIATYGSLGLTVLSYIVGLTDINPFIINLYQTHATTLPAAVIATATINAVAGNTLLHGVYSLLLCAKELRRPLMIGYVVLVATVLGASIVVGVLWS
ncbi:MAG: DUF4010 domain-containing protein [Bacteroidetes bacterium]|nr:DUF4010 domain-containing protein [Bacteroidota bacterium]